MARNTRSSFACARCYKRKKKCDRGYPSCSQCTMAQAQCIGLDRDSETELPRSLVSYLEDLVARLELELEQASIQGGKASSLLGDARRDAARDQPLVTSSTITSSRESTAAYRLAGETAQQTAPAASFGATARHALPYYSGFFMGAELPFPLAFRTQRPIKIPTSHTSTGSARLPAEVAGKLMVVYIDRILPQYPILSRLEVEDMFQRCKMSGGGGGSATASEHFMVSMMMAIATLSSRARDYRIVVSVAESLRLDAFSNLDFVRTFNSATTTTIRQLLLLVQYGYLLPSSANLWHLAGEAMRIALELGLHHEAPPESQLTDAAVESRRRLFWTLYMVERSVAITSHRPWTVPGDQIHATLPSPEDDEPLPETVLAQPCYVRLTDRLQFLRLQAEICSVNIGMRPIPNPRSTYEDWIVDVQLRISEASARAATPRTCSVMEAHALLLLHMPCARNPRPDEASVLKYFRAAIKVANEYWELIESDSLDYPWHATHHCYEAGNLILYSLWHFRAVIRRHYSTKQIFEAVNQVSSFFILVVKKWPAAQQCGTMFDNLRKGALASFREEGSDDLESNLEARQLRELVFRENADLLYAREQQISAALDQPMASTLLSDLEVEQITLAISNDTDFLDFFSFSEASDFGTLDQVAMEVEDENRDLLASPVATPGLLPDVADATAKCVINQDQLRAAMSRLPVCSHCKRRRIKCDLSLPACRNCTKLGRECFYLDNALTEETSRKHIYALHQHVEALMKEVQRLHEPREAISGLDALSPTGMAQSSASGTHPLTVPNDIPIILCANDLDEASSIDTLFFGATSSFARLAAAAGEHFPGLSELTMSSSRPPTVFETLSGSLTLRVATDISQAEAQNLVWQYYRCIEVTYPILGHRLISQTLDDAYSSSTGSRVDVMVRTRFNLILAIALALLSADDPRLQVVADTYFFEAIAAAPLSDQFVTPASSSLQLVLLLCVYAWLRPGVMDVWRLFGHASRLCLDIVEVQGSRMTDSVDGRVLYRTLYALETHISIAFGRPNTLPDGHEVLADSPNPDGLAAGELSTMVYQLARHQNRVYRDMSRRDFGSPGHATVAPSSSWMAVCIQEMRGWLGSWTARVEAMSNGFAGPQAGAEVKELLISWGQFQQADALLLARMASQRRGQTLISPEDEANLCKQLLRAAGSLHRGPAGAGPPAVSFPLTWTRSHAVFTAMTLLLQQARATPLAADVDADDLLRVGLDVLLLANRSGERATAGLVDCWQRMHSFSTLPGSD